MKLKISSVIDLFNGLRGLDGLQKASAQEGQPVFVPFKFTGKFTLLKVKLINILRLQVEEYNEAVKNIGEQHKAEPGEDPASALEKAKARLAAMQQLNADEHEVAGLRKFRIADLNLYDPETNPKGNVIAATIIEQVLPLIEDDPAPAEKPAAPGDEA